MTSRDNNLIAAVVQRLADRLPPGWRIDAAEQPVRQGQSRLDAVLRIRAPGSTVGSVLVEAKQRVEPREVDYWANVLRPVPERPILIVAPFLSPRVQDRLKAKGFAYADLTGNLRLILSKPALFVETRGAEKNPQPVPRERRSLRGAKAGRLIRALCDFRPPLGLRELARRAGVDAGYASRIVDFLDREALVVREQRGPITNTDWAGLLRRWSQEYSPFKRNRVQWYLAARGLGYVTEKLRNLPVRYAVSGSWAATQFAPISPPRLLLCYAESVLGVVKQLDLRPVDAGANVAVAEPFDSVVYERTSQQKGVTVAAVSQIAADLFTAPGRGPNEAEALVEWMGKHEDGWRT